MGLLVVYGGKTGFEGGHELKFEPVHPVEKIDPFFLSGIGDTAAAYVLIQFFVCEAQIILVRFPAQSVRRRFLDQYFRDAKRSADRFYLLNGEAGKRTEITCGVLVE